MKMKTKTITDITLIALMAAIISVCSWITVPLGAVPFTLQTFGVFLALRFLGGKKGTASIAVYILLGIAGLPVFSNFGSGIGKIAGPTGGFIFGFLFVGIIIILMEKFDNKSKLMRAAVDLLSLIVLYATGTAWFWLFMGKAKGMGIFAILSACVFPFILPDLLKIFLAEAVSKAAGKLKKNI